MKYPLEVLTRLAEENQLTVTILPDGVVWGDPVHVEKLRQLAGEVPDELENR